VEWNQTNPVAARTRGGPCVVWLRRRWSGVGGDVITQGEQGRKQATHLRHAIDELRIRPFGCRAPQNCSRPPHSRAPLSVAAGRHRHGPTRAGGGAPHHTLLLHHLQRGDASRSRVFQWVTTELKNCSHFSNARNLRMFKFEQVNIK
jgi:hypothetical protein